SAEAFVTLAQVADSTAPGRDLLGPHLGSLVEGTIAGGQRVALCDSCATHLELHLTAEFFRFAERRYGGHFTRDIGRLGWFIPRAKKDFSRLADSLAAGTMDLSAYEPLHPQYRRLKVHLARYHGLADVPWPALELPPLAPRRLGLVPGDNAPLIVELRHRLQALGDLALADSSTVYDSTLAGAVRSFQLRHGLSDDGVIGPAFIKAINVSPAERVRTMLVNMERLRWAPDVQPDDMLLVNIPEYRLHVYEAGAVVMSMRVVVGTTVNRTVIFNDTLSTIVFSPTWTVPPGIARNEILPAIAKDPNYLRKENMEIIGGSESQPVFRQRPGPNNALGRVKFLFPNSYHIYMHDTPAQASFARDQRAFSHGCIRLAEPRALAEYLLRNDSTWTEQRITAAMRGGKEVYVPLAEKLPVMLVYFTAWEDGNGQLNFREDVYNHDRELASELFR
ncbi:MAG TPA: L,D-transpeptidase family protein, partial [Gemmatimonadales bacterium]|nr:L,D-transpeptidase family protein [Gemmatimonadales bacterium]